MLYYCVSREKLLESLVCAPHSSSLPLHSLSCFFIFCFSCSCYHDRIKRNVDDDDNTIDAVFSFFLTLSFVLPPPNENFYSMNFPSVSSSFYSIRIRTLHSYFFFITTLFFVCRNQLFCPTYTSSCRTNKKADLTI